MKEEQKVLFWTFGNLNGDAVQWNLFCQKLSKFTVEPVEHTHHRNHFSLCVSGLLSRFVETEPI